MAEAFRKTSSKVMYVSEVGHEDRVLRIRQVATGKYDRYYRVLFAPGEKATGIELNDHILLRLNKPSAKPRD